MKNSKSQQEFFNKLVPEENSHFFNLTIRKFERSIKNELSQKLSPRRAFCESDTEENESSNRRNEDCSGSMDRYLDINKQIDLKCVKYIEIDKRNDIEISNRKNKNSSPVSEYLDINKQKDMNCEEEIEKINVIENSNGRINHYSLSVSRLDINKQKDLNRCEENKNGERNDIFSSNKSHNNCLSSVEEYQDMKKQNDVNCNKDLENGKMLICEVDNKNYLSKNIDANNLFPKWIKSIETLKIEGPEDDFIVYKKILSSRSYNDHSVSALYRRKERKDFTDSLTKIKKLGVNPFQIGVLINKRDFLEHCKMVKNGSLKQSVNTKKVSSHIEKTRLEQSSKDLRVIADNKSISTSTGTVKENEMVSNEQRKIACGKFVSQENFIIKARFHEGDQEITDISYSKSISDLIQLFESNCDGNKHKKKRNCARSVKRNMKTNCIKSNRNGEIEAKLQTQYKREDIENGFLFGSMQKVKNSFVYNVSDQSEQESQVTLFQPKNIANSSTDNHSDFFIFLEAFLFLAVMATVFWHLIVV